MVSKVALAVLVLSCSFAAVFATKSCYLCNSYSDTDHTACVDPMSPYPYVNYTYCADSYVCTRVSYITQKQFVVSRGCDVAGDTCNNIYRTLYSYYPDISSYNCYFCTANYCNGASGLRYSSEFKEIEAVEADVPTAPKEAEKIVVNVV